MKIYKGKVVSTKMQKTANIMVERVIAHPVYKKRIVRSKKYHVHDIIGVKEGQVVRFVESKPYSKTKRWRITEVVGEQKTGKVIKK
ncbi:30S ribosomal protein S17 [Candidatus Woesebacteria bacterium RIFCSPHIGHO2_01_FULL_38_9b]|uniref:Small ribosomal subunit protein uS17 n=1 Tax=Candidatus Woesebacteria bacterium RIFCSPHIGHO2_01_FULL_38_9b TaxID=1802493 RepID=A0A1F7Y1V5_9BACT|nr:MAG: 30S ribosomal protein S17 [Candidatus Woesebacteria bacterium RIFCSPHIGHO2_01_FULL_38_9b]